MKIVYVGNFSQRHCTEVHIALTLEELGHEVIRIQEDGFSSYELSDKLDDMYFDLFLFTRTWGKTVQLYHLENLRLRGIPSASYHLDLYVGISREAGLDDDPFWRTDYVFTPDGSEQASKVFKAKGINHHYIKPAVYKGECMVKGKRRELPVLFVGGGSAEGEPHQYGHNEWSYRGKLIKFLRDTYGEKFTKKGWPEETVRNEALNQLYADADVVVGDSLCLNFDHPYYWSDRVYETLGRGGFIIHPYIKGMDEEFEDGTHLVYYEYNNWDQLKEKIDYYLENSDEREKIRKAGHEFVKENATYHNRLQQALGIINGSGTVPTPLPDNSLKISLGAGTEIEDGFINVDIVALEGIDVVHNLMQFPYPFKDNSAEFIRAKDLIEHLATHLPDGRNTLIAFIEECHRILQVGGTLWIQTPSWDADFLWIDPTHVRGYDIRSFDFFDPDTDFGRSTGFYSDCKFTVKADRLENGNLQFELVKL